MRRLMLAAAVALSVPGPLAWAQVPATQDHDAHPPQIPTQAPAPTQTGPMPMNRMGNNMPMMGMMRMMGPTVPGMDGMATIDRVEGRIAFLRAELNVTDAQTTAWNAFAEALRANAKKLGEVRASMMAPPSAGQQAPTLADRLELQERWLLARLEGTRTIKVTFTNLYGALSDDQKKTADELVAPHIGMGMMRMMQGQIQPGQNYRYGERRGGPRGSGRDDDYRYGERRGFGPRGSDRDGDYGYGERRGFEPRGRDGDYRHGFGPRGSGRDDDGER